MHLELMAQLQAILPKKAHCIFLGGGEIDGIQLQEALKQNALCLPNS